MIPESQTAFKDNDIDLLLDMVSDFVNDDIVDNNDEPTGLGLEFELLYDRIYSGNP